MLRVKNLKTIAAATLALLVSLPFEVSFPVMAAETNTTSTFTDSYERINAEVKATYSNGITPLENDFYCITLQRQLNVNEDPEKVDLRHIEVDAKNGIRGCMDSGWFNVVGIKYYGENQLLRTTPVATKAVIRVFKDEPVTVPLSIGAQAVRKLKEEWEDVYEQKDGDSKYGENDSIIAIHAPEERTVFSDLSVFGNDEEAKQRYLKYLEEEELVDEKYQFTDKAKSLFADNPDGLDAASPDVLDKDASVTDVDESKSAEVTPVPTDTAEADSHGDANDKVKTTHFDEVEETEEEKGHPIFAFIIKYIPYVLAVITIVGFLWWNKRN